MATKWKQVKDWSYSAPAGKVTCGAKVANGLAIHKADDGWRVSHAASGLSIFCGLASAKLAERVADVLGVVPDDPAAALDIQVPLVGQIDPDVIAQQMQDEATQAAQDQLEAAVNTLRTMGPVDPPFQVFTTHPDKIVPGAKAAKRAARFLRRSYEGDPLGCYLVTDSGMVCASDGYRAVMIPSDYAPGCFDRQGEPFDDEGCHPLRKGLKQIQSDVAAGGGGGYVDALRAAKVLQMMLTLDLPGNLVSLAGHGGRVFLACSPVGQEVFKVDIGVTIHEGGDFRQDFNARFLLDALKGAKAARLDCQSRDPLGPIGVHRDDGERHIIMPML